MPLLQQWQQRLETLQLQAKDKLLAADNEALSQVREQQFAQLSAQLQGVALLQYCPDHIKARILGLGEQFSVALMTGLLKYLQIDTVALDSVTCVKSQGDYLNAVADIPASEAALSAAVAKQQAQVYVMAGGFVSSNSNGELCLLGA